MNWISYTPHPRTTVITTNKYDGPSRLVCPTPRLITSVFQQHYCHILAAHMTDSVECWWGTTSRVQCFRWRKFPLFYSRLKTIWDWELLASTASLVSVAMFTSARQNVKWRSGWNNTNETFDLYKLTSLPWRNIVLTTAIGSSSKTLQSSQPSLDTW
jgi:hypothetical protein